VVTDTFRAPAVGCDLLSFSGSLGQNPAKNVAHLIYDDGKTSPVRVGGTKMQDILENLKTNFRLPSRVGAVWNHESVTLNAAGTDDNIPDGSIVIRGQPKSAFAIKDASVRVIDANSQSPSPNFFNTNMNMTVLRSATETQIAEMSAPVFDGLGKEQLFTMRFIPTGKPNYWLWNVKIDGRENTVH
jgi:hypothetical protein